jgi:hypothetical protein
MTAFQWALGRVAVLVDHHWVSTAISSEDFEGQVH